MTRTLSACAMAALVATPASASDAELAAIREQIRQLRETYETRIQALEKRLADAEARAPRADTAMAAAAPGARDTPRASGESAFNPAISLILSGTYASLREDPDAYRITGFVPSLGEVGPGRRGFSLGESELVVTANIDPLFRGQFTAALTPENEVEVEEAFVQTLALGSGLTLKAGRFFSGIGYLNEQHAHSWDFVDAPLAYKAFVGNQLGEDGVQLRWVAPTELFIEIGAEAGRGRRFPGSDRNKNGSSQGAVFAHAGGDIGPSHSWRAGLSFVKTSPDGRCWADDGIACADAAVATKTFDGRSRTWIADLVWKWAPQGNSAITNLKVQGEYFRRREEGTLDFDDSAFANTFGAVVDGLSLAQSGWYLQGVYQFAPGWRAGLRYDRLNYGRVDLAHLTDGSGLSLADFPELSPHDPRRATLMFDWSPSEFSRWRLQLADDRSRLGVTDRQLYIQYNVSLGAHGAHRY